MLSTRLLLILTVAAGVLGGCSTGQAATPSATPSPTETVTEILLPPVSSAAAITLPATAAAPPGLLAVVPPAYRASCSTTRPSFAGATQALECNPSGDPQQISYWKFDDRAALNAALGHWTKELIQDTGDCRTTFDGHLTWQQDGATVGDLVCTQEGWAWTGWRTDILAVAMDEYFHAPDFYQWWAANGGTIA